MKTPDPFFEMSQVLKKSARSFYLSLMIFPSVLKKQVSVAYYFCKMADTIVDLDYFSQQDKEKVLLEFFKVVTGSLPLDDFMKVVETKSLSQYREPLFPGLKSALILFQEFSTDDQKNIREVVREVMLGMEIDLKRGALESELELDQYCHYVAGSAGAFLTKTFYQYQLIKKEYEKMVDFGIQLGKGLQLTNIIRDRIEDRKKKRFYLPSGSYFSSDAVIYPKALSYLENGLNYVIALPRGAWKIRLASLCPILFALKTLSRVAESSSSDSCQKNKISRFEIYLTLLISGLLIFSNQGIKLYFDSIRKQIHLVAERVKR